MNTILTCITCAYKIRCHVTFAIFILNVYTCFLVRVYSTAREMGKIRLWTKSRELRYWRVRGNTRTRAFATTNMLLMYSNASDTTTGKNRCWYTLFFHLCLLVDVKLPITSAYPECCYLCRFKKVTWSPFFRCIAVVLSTHRLNIMNLKVNFTRVLSLCNV